MSRAPHYNKELKYFAGAARIIPNDLDILDSPHVSSHTNSILHITFASADKTRKSVNKKRESTDKTRKYSCNKTIKHPCPPFIIPYNNSDFEPIKSMPISKIFQSNASPGSTINNVDMEVIR